MYLALDYKLVIVQIAVIGGHIALSTIVAEDSVYTLKLAVMLLSLKGIQHFLYQIIYVYQLQLCSGIIYLYGQVICYVVAEGSHGAVVVGLAPFAENVWETVDQHLCPSRFRVFKKQLFPGLFASAIVTVIATDKGNLNEGGQHHGAGIALFF